MEIGKEEEWSGGYKMHRNLFLFQRIYISGAEHKTHKNRKISPKEQNIPSKIALQKHNTPGYDKPINDSKSSIRRWSSSKKKEKVCNCDTDANSEGEYIRDDQGSLIMDCLIMWAMLGSMYHSQDDTNLQCIVGFVSSS